MGARWVAMTLAALTMSACTKVGAPSPVAAPAGTRYSNPILGREQSAGADPAVLFHEGTYYFYSTNPGNNVFTSTDLVHWKKGPAVLGPEFKGAWAPEVYRHPEDGKFYLYYTKRYKIGVAVSDTPDGLFKDLGLLVINAIDPHVFRDDDGRLYLYFTHTPSFTMYCVPLKSPTQTGHPITKCFEISQDWERHSFAINEGPYMLKRNGIYYLLYSGSDGQSSYYAVGYATGPTPIGPFTKYAKNPVFQDLAKIHGPGHGSVIGDRAGQLWHLYHQKIDGTKGWKRDICLDRLQFDAEGRLGGTPTRGVELDGPICDPSLVWIPEIHPRGAFFEKTVKVTLATRTEGAEIRYTLDGKDPTQKSPLYRGPLTVSRSTVVKARALKKGMHPSAVAMNQFTKASGALPVNLSPAGEAAVPPFDVFPLPNLNWKPPVKPTESR